jgi:hypothetical protein
LKRVLHAFRKVRESFAAGKSRRRLRFMPIKPTSEEACVVWPSRRDLLICESGGRPEIDPTEGVGDAGGDAEAGSENLGCLCGSLFWLMNNTGDLRKDAAILGQIVSQPFDLVEAERCQGLRPTPMDREKILLGLSVPN